MFQKQTPCRIPRTHMVRIYDRVRRGEKRPTGDVQVIFIDRGYCRRLNRTFRNKDKATDVLSFSLARNEREVCGEIYICVPIALQQAREYAASEAIEYSRLFLHALLHLYGYDHMVPVDAGRMHRRERQYWRLVFGDSPEFPE